MRHAAALLGMPSSFGRAALALYGGMLFAKADDENSRKSHCQAALRVRTGGAEMLKERGPE
jgi:hypothetical protein